MSFNQSRIPDDLKRAYMSGHCAVLVGAGASTGAGLPLWGELLERMLNYAIGNRLINEEKANQYRVLISKSDKYLSIATGLKEDIGNSFDRFMKETFIGSSIKPTQLHEALVALDKLQFVLTTNYDTLLEKSYRRKDEDVAVCMFTDVGEIQRCLSKREFFILKAHGDASKAGNGLILTESDYRRLLYRERAYQSLMSAMFTMFTFVFVGASLVDPEIKLLLGYIADVFMPESGPTHYALMAEEDITAIEEDHWYRDFRVKIIPVSKKDNFQEVTDFLVALKDC
jgi:hypothetical protein